MAVTRAESTVESYYDLAVGTWMSCYQLLRLYLASAEECWEELEMFALGAEEGVYVWRAGHLAAVTSLQGNSTSIY